MIPALAILIALSGGTELVAEDESTDTESALLLGVQAGPYSWGARAGRDDGDTEIEYAGWLAVETGDAEYLRVEVGHHGGKWYTTANPGRVMWEDAEERVGIVLEAGLTLGEVRDTSAAVAVLVRIY